jgi:hypothetical protein
MPPAPDIVVDILRGTHDGQDLSPDHLGLVEGYMCLELTSYGEEVLLQVHADVMAGRYQKPWFHGIEHLTMDHQGYVRYKGHRVENFLPHFMYTAEAKKYALEIAKRCQAFKESGHPLDMSTMNITGPNSPNEQA